MKRFFSIGVLIALAALTLGSCAKDIEEEVVVKEPSLAHSVSFNVSMGDQTRTGLAFKFVPNWIKTDEKNNVHLFETNQGETIEGENVVMEIEEGRHNEVAHFSAEFYNMTIIVNPPSGTSALTRAGGDSYYYTGIVAKKVDNKFIVPEVQYPDSEALIDPNADFLVGDGRKGYDVSQSEKPVDLYFLRPVAASRLAIMNVEKGTVIKKVVITSSAKLTGSAAYDAINFETGAVSFDANSGSTSITLDYGDGVAIPDEATFYAYFISLPGNKPITSIEVTTDTHVYTKNVNKTLNFKTEDFKNIAVDMSKVTPTPVDPTPTTVDQPITFHKNNGTITADSFTLGSGTYVLPTLEGVAEGATVVWTLENPDPEDVASLTYVGNVWTLTPQKAGSVTVKVTASAVEGYNATTVSYPLTIEDAGTQALVFTPDALTVTLGEEFTEPALTGNKTAVTYSIDPEGVATIDAATGELTLVAAGTATVTATAAAGTGTDGKWYAGNTATYDLTVNAPASAVKYYKVDEIVAGQEYIVVSNGQALTVNGTTVGAVAVEDNDGVIETSASVALWTAAEHVEYYSGTSAAGHYTLKNGDNYLQRLSNQSTQTVTVGAVPSTGKYYVWEYDGTHLYHLSSASNTFYMGYSDGWKFNYQTPYYEASLYSTTKPLTKQTIAFVAETVQYDLNGGTGTVQAPAWSEGNEPKTNVAYASDSEVITVNATTGVVSVSSAAKVGDSATITATAEQTTEYASATATFTVVVIDSTPVEETTYTLVSNALTAGTYILISDDSSSSYNNRYTVALFPTVVTTSWEGTSPVQNGQRFNEKDVTLSGSSITTTDPEIVGSEVELEESGSGWKIKAKKTGEYLVAPTESYRIPVSTNASDAAVFTISTAQNRSITTGGYYFFHSGSATGFTIRNTGSTVSNVRFYKKAKKTQSIAFTGTSAEYDLKDGGSWTIAVPELDASGAETTISYASSKTTVAEVDPTTGAITIPSTAKKGDSAVITATAEETDEYEEATATYTISIVDSTPGVMATYKKVTSTAGLRAGAKYLLVFEGLAGDTDGDGDPKVFSAELNSDGTQFLKNKSAALDVTIASGVIESSDFADYQFTLEAASSGYYLKGDTANKYIYPGSSGSSSVMLAEASASHALTIAFSDGIAEIENGGRYLVWSTSNHYFSCNTDVSGRYSTGICLYRLDDGTPDPVAQTIAFTPAAAEYDLYTKAWTPSMPVLGGAQTTVTYLSSDATVASVAADGTITPLAVGEVTITANAEASSAYLAATATCTVTVTDSTPIDPSTAYYQRVTASSEFVQDGTYIIVNESNNKVFKPVLNSSNTNFQTTGNTIDVTITDGKIASSSTVDACQIVLKNADGNGKFALFVPSVSHYLQVYNGSNFKADASDNGYRSTFSVTSAGVASIYRDNNHYIRYSESSSAFQVGSNSNNIAVYRYVSDGGTTPDDPEPPTPETPTYTKVDAITSGATYLIVSTDANSYNGLGKQRAFAGDQAGTAVEVDGTSGTITGDYSSCEFVITQSGSDYTLLGPNGYVTGNSGNSYSPQWIQVSSSPVTMSLTDAASLSTAAAGDGLVSDAFYFYYNKNSSKEVLYLNKTTTTITFKIGGSGRKYGVYLYKKN